MAVEERDPVLGEVAAASAATPERRPLVELADVNKHFGELHVLRDINLTVLAGEVVVIIGPSGSGKSTLCRTINRLEPIDDGSIKVDGVPLPAEGKGWPSSARTSAWCSSPSTCSPTARCSTT